MTMLSFSGIEVFGMSSDAGGSNRRLFSMLRGGKLVGEAATIEKSLLGFKHPCSDHNVAYFFCSVHSFKNCRNTLLNSNPCCHPEGTKGAQKKEGSKLRMG